MVASPAFRPSIGTMPSIRWIFDQPLLVQYAILLPPMLLAGLAAWALLGRHNRLLRKAERAAQRAMEAARQEGLAVRSCWVSGAVDIQPAALAIVFHVVDDATLAAAEASGAAQRLREQTLEELGRERYPGPPGSVGLVSDETVDRHGGPSVYFR
jgi:hypothetical protein